MMKTGLHRPAYTIYHLFWNLIDWVFPPVCGGCDTAGERWCYACQTSVERIPFDGCPVCGEPQSIPHSLCPTCQAHPPVYQALRSWGRYQGPLRQAIIRLKYDRDIGLGEALSKHLIELYNNLKWDADLIVPVPLSQTRLKQRGYNQSELLALPLAYAAHKPIAPGALARTRDTLSQTRLTARERRTNVENAFRANSNTVSGKVILVVDDVTTTGSTISACAQALSSAGAAAVFGLTLARSVLQTDAEDQSIKNIP